MFPQLFMLDGKALNEYQVEYDDSQKLVSCWIPSQVGKEFSIQVRNTTSNERFRFTVEMDGDLTNCRSLDPQGLQVVDRCRPSPTTYRSSVFSKGQPVDDDDVSVNLTRAAGVGSIAIKVMKGKRGNQRITSSAMRNIRIPEKRKIPERAKKGIATCIALGPVRTRAPEKLRKEPEFITTGLHADFVFRYRPLDFLQAPGIAPPPPAKSSNNEPRVVNTRKGKKSSSQAKPKAGLSKVRHIGSRTRAARDIFRVKIKAERDLKKLRALRTKIDKLLAEKAPKVRPKKEHKTVIIPRNEIIDLT